MSNCPRYLVLVPSDLQRSPALFRAMALARRSEASLTLGLFEYQPMLQRVQGKGFSLDAYLEGRRRELEQFASHLRRDGFSVETVLRWGSPMTAQVLQEIESLGPALVIKDAESARDVELLRLCPVPLMLVRPGNHNLPAHIAAAVDPLDENDGSTNLNQRILEAAERYGMLCSADVEVAHAFEAVPPMASAVAFSGYALVDELRRLHQEALQGLGAKFGVEPRHLHMLEGFAPLAVRKFVSTYRIDLLIVGTTLRNGLERLMLGSVAEQLFDRLDCDLLAVKTAAVQDKSS